MIYSHLPNFEKKSQSTIASQNREVFVTYKEKGKTLARRGYSYKLSNEDTKKLIDEHHKAAQGHSHDERLN